MSEFKIENKYIAKLIKSYFPKCGNEITLYEHQANFMNRSGLNPCMQIYDSINCTCEYAQMRTTKKKELHKK